MPARYPPVDAPDATTGAPPKSSLAGWHPLGPLFEGVTTPLNTEELSLTTGLPRRDVPGLRFVPSAVRFATNPPPTTGRKDLISLGRVVDTRVALTRTLDARSNGDPDPRTQLAFTWTSRPSGVRSW